MKQLTSNHVLLIGFFLHLIFLASVFDIYFKTPIVQGIESHPNPVPGPAKRLVFIVTDGLRADSFYSNRKGSTPFLRSKIENDASWGVSHTRVPTESRPGVVALAAGIYEDPSAVFKGWKENPVEFDSLFNQSQYTWAWGSPDIVHMFKQDHVETMSYSPDDEDFSGKYSSWKLDEWVFNRVKSMFKEAEHNSTLQNLLHRPKIIFFLHLLGLDTAGHTIKPQSLRYQDNLRVVDRGVSDIEEVIESFYNDGKTSFVLTADHGMTNWGSHGAGSKDETEVPLLAWGAGVKGPEHSTSSDLVNPMEWQLSHLKRKDVKQADIVVLLTSLIGCKIPVNSLGRLPKSYLNLPEEDLAKLEFLNAQQLLSQAERKRELVQRGTFSWLYRPFGKLTAEETELKIKLIRQYIQSKKYGLAVGLSEELSDLSVFALQYYHNYYQSLLLAVISISFFGWIAMLLCHLHRCTRMECPDYIHKIFIILSCTTTTLIYAQGLDWQFYVYCLLPLAIWWNVLSMKDSWSYFLSRGVFKFIVVSAVLIIFTEIMVAAFFHRWVLSVGMLFVAMWPIFETEKVKSISPLVLFLWLLSCAFVSIFPLLPVIGSDSSMAILVLSGALWLTSIAGFHFWISKSGRVRSHIWRIDTWMRNELSTEVTPVILSIVVVFLTAKSYEKGHGLPIICQILAWIILCYPISLFFIESKAIPKRLMLVHSSILPSYILLSVRHEVLFLLALCFHLVCWLLLEANLNSMEPLQLMAVKFPPFNSKEMSRRLLTIQDFRRAALFVFYIFYSFFGTGNIASLNSFEVVWVRCFLSVFSPFTMMFLILLKMLIPFVLVSSTFRAINVLVKAPTGLMFMAVLIICDLMGVHFLYLVTNEGSWLDIGTSISHYVIVQVTVLALVLIYGIASILTGFYISFDEMYSHLDLPRL